MQMTTGISGGCRPVDSYRTAIPGAISISVGGKVYIDVYSQSSHARAGSPSEVLETLRYIHSFSRLLVISSRG
jgi:hypothetical protein